MAKGLSLQNKLIAIILPFALVGGVLAFVFAPQAESGITEFTTTQEDNFALRLSPPPQLSVTGAESFIIKCTLQNVVDVIDVDGQLRQRIQKTSSQFSPAIELDFLISTSAMEEFGRADVKTSISCGDNSLSAQGFGAFLYDGFVTTTISGQDFDRNTKQLAQKTRQVSGITDLTNKNNQELNSLTVEEGTLDRILKDDKDYTALITVTTVGELKFRQCVSGQFCVGADASASWLHNIAGGKK